MRESLWIFIIHSSHIRIYIHTCIIYIHICIPRVDKRSAPHHNGTASETLIISDSENSRNSKPSQPIGDHPVWTWPIPHEHNFDRNSYELSFYLPYSFQWHSNLTWHSFSFPRHPLRLVATSMVSFHWRARCCRVVNLPPPVGKYSGHRSSWIFFVKFLWEDLEVKWSYFIYDLWCIWFLLLLLWCSDVCSRKDKIMWRFRSGSWGNLF